MKSSKVMLAVPLAMALATVTLVADNHDKKTDVTITEPLQVPGGVVLEPGKYMFILNSSASTRNIVEIKSEDGKRLYAMMFTTRAARVKRTSKTTLTFYEMPAGQPEALRQWFWPGDYDGQEFLYPASEAGKIRNVTHEKVPEATDQEYSDLKTRGPSTSSEGSGAAGQAQNTQR